MVYKFLSTSQDYIDPPLPFFIDEVGQTNWCYLVIHQACKSVLIFIGQKATSYLPKVECEHLANTK